MTDQLKEDGYTMAELTEALEVARSTVYWNKNRKSKPVQAEPVEEAISKKAKEGRCTYGVKRLRIVLSKSTPPVRTSERRIRRVLDDNQFRVRAKRAYRIRTTQSDPSASPSPDFIEEKGLPKSIDHQWVTDITYIKTGEGWCYLCSFMDRYSQRILGWAIDTHMRSELVEQALKQALHKRQIKEKEDLIIHSDRGSQYTAKSFRKLLKQIRAQQSMRPKGDCYANAHAESL